MSDFNKNELKKNINGYIESLNIIIELENDRRMKKRTLLERLSTNSNLKKPVKKFKAETLYNRFPRGFGKNMVGYLLQCTEHDITDGNINKNEFSKRMELPMFLLKIAEEGNQVTNYDNALTYMNKNINLRNVQENLYMKKFQLKINTQGITLNDIYKLGLYFQEDFESLKEDSAFSYYYKIFNVFVRDYVNLSNEVFVNNFENIRSIFLSLGLKISKLEVEKINYPL